MRTIIWLNTGTVIENEIEHLTKKLKTAKKKKNKSAIKRIEKEINKFYKLLQDLE
jgi:uncharacterized membrane protein (DUF106 family)